jgi:tetratricopeptide (TPR) repeat protein
LDEIDLLPGQYWRIEIPKAVRQSDVVLICLSSSSISKRGYVQKEIKFALDAADEQPEDAIFIIPVKLEECTVPERLSAWQWVSLYDPKGFNKLVHSLQMRARELGIPIEELADQSTAISGSLNSGSSVDAPPAKQKKAIRVITRGKIVTLLVLIMLSIAIVWVIGKIRGNTDLTDTGRMHFNLGLTLANQRNFAEAENEFREALRTAPSSALTHNALAQTLGNQAKLTEAETEFKEAIRIDPNYADAYNGLGMTLNSELRYPDAEAAFRNALRVNPNYAGAHSNLGFTLFYQQRYPEAEEHFRQAIKYEPSPAPPEPYNGLGLVLNKQGRYEEALAAFRDALAHYKDFAQAHNGLGVALSHQTNPASAMAEFREAIRLDPNLAEAYYNLGVALLSQRQDEPAEDSFRKASSRDLNYSNNEKFHLFLGLSLAGQSKFAAATDEFELAIGLNRADPIPHNAKVLALVAQKRELETGLEINELKQVAPNFVAANDFKQLRSRAGL